METKKLLSNENYSLSKLFSTSYRKIIIPDFQRDYCWGDKSHGEKKDKDIVSDFLDTLFEEFNNNNTEVLLGKIDAYENPTDHIYLTDGQQRLTTLYLLIGMLHKKFRETYLKNCLISDFEELQDDQEPYLQYAVRETTVFFLRDLVNEFFIKDNKLKVSDIINENWFFNEYSLDPSIKSMLLALEIIEKKSADLNSEFCEFVVKNIKIQYYNVEDKKHGEERFVILNTTGKSLTVSENIKPILLGNTQNSELARQWEERETWFWKNKKKDENISDEGVNDFLTWYFKLKKQKEDIDVIKEAKSLLKNNENEENLKKIHSDFEALKSIISLLENEKFQDQFTFINEEKKILNIVDLRNLNLERLHNILLPLIAFITKFEDTESAYQFLRRLRKNYFDLKRKYRKNNYLDWRYVLQIIEKSNSLEEILTFDTIEDSVEKIQNIPVNIWYNDEEKMKKQLSQNKSTIEKWEDHIDLMGDISLILNSNYEEIKSIDSLSSNYFTFKDIYECYNEKSSENNKNLSNFLRLYRVLIESSRIGHINRTSGMKGLWFSWKDYRDDQYLEYLKNPEFLTLLKVKENDLLSEIKKRIREKISREETIINEENFTATKHLKSWMLIKVLQAEKNDVLLSFYDGNGIATYFDYDQNKINNDLDLSLANSICGYGIKSGFGAGNEIRYADECWGHQDCFDTTIGDSITLAKFQKRKTNPISLENIKNIEQQIDSLLDNFYK